MTLLSEGRRKARRPSYRVILSHPDLDSRERGGGQSDLLDWKARFGRRSPLSRKIITFNLVALGVLLTGVLYLNQFQGGLLELRTRALVNEARLLGHVLADELGDGDPVGAIEEIQRAAGFSEARVVFYGPDGERIGSVDKTEVGGPPQPASQTAYTAIMGEIWDRVSRLFAARHAAGGDSLSPDTLDPLVMRALTERVALDAVGTTPAGEPIITVALPVTDGATGELYGALGVTARPGDVDGFIRAEREKILQVFALATIISIFLSLVLANTIVRPLRDLSEAAHEGGTRDSRQVNPERINIPDMSTRPDEIGYLSGAMRLMTAALYDRIEANEAFAADVAHEIKNPLTSLRSAVETIPYAKTDADRERLIAVIKQDVNRLDRLVTDISNASRLDSELVRDRMEPFDLAQLLTNLVEFNSGQAEKAGARLRLNCHDEPLAITGLEGRLAQVFVNLITNAISFAGEGDTITVSTMPHGRNRIRVLVEDEGPGIPDENLADVFERFYSQRPEREEYGNHSGLGLAISRQIVQAHGGAIWAENIRPEGAGRETPPLGARFVVELPV